jgi:CubicO group peptidase (beta-lactamase class C family)
MNFKSFIQVLFICVSFLSVNYSYSQTKNKTGAPSKTTSNKALEAKLDSIFSSYNKSTPGIAVTVLQNGKVLAKKAYGLASLEFSVPFNHNMLVRIPYSEGREFISITAALMEKDGLLHLNDKVRKYFPKLPEWSEPVTIQDLLNHSSGFDDEWATLALTQASMANVLEKSQFLNFLYNQPNPAVEPGKGYMYSNSDFGLLRLILEKASGEDLSMYMKRKVFDPLQMKDSRIHNNKEEVIPNHAPSYLVGENKSFKLWLQDKTSPGGNYYVLTSANDLEKWATAHADSNSIISWAVQRLKRDARPMPVVPVTSYVFGHKLKKIDRYDVVAHMGVNELTYMAHVPEKKLTVICISNSLLPRWRWVSEVLSAALGVKTQTAAKNIFPDQPVTINAEAINRFAGTYRWNVPLTYQSFTPRKRFTEFVSRNEVLAVIYETNDTLDLVPVGQNIFKDPEFPDFFVFSLLHPDSAMKAVMYTYDGERIEMEKVQVTIPKLSKEYLQKLTGKYYSGHLDYYLTIVLNESNELVVKRPTIADKILYPSADGEFQLVTDYGPYSSESWVRFYFNNKREVSHFTVSHPRLMHHRFDKVQ